MWNCTVETIVRPLISQRNSSLVKKYCLKVWIVEAKQFKTAMVDISIIGQIEPNFSLLD